MSLETARELVPATPPAAVAGLHLAGIQLADWALISTIIYTLMMAIVILPKVINTIKGWLHVKDPRK
jgi:antibiotic biosynthesis monooxygenase (ABM) superfamily enzyme